MVSAQGFFGSSIPSVSFDKIGDKVRGRVIDVEIRQQIDMDTNTPMTWNDGRPRMQAVTTLETHQPTNEDDSGLHNLYIRGYMQNDVRGALRAIHSQVLTNGMWLEVTFAKEDEPRRRGMKGARHFDVIAWTAANPPEWATDFPPTFENASTGAPKDEAGTEEPPF
jgi:hypothetical protein